MKRLLAPTSILLAMILLAVNTPAIAVDRTFQIEVENSLKGTVPSNWVVACKLARRDAGRIRVASGPGIVRSLVQYPPAKGDPGKPLQGDPWRHLEPDPAGPGHCRRAGCRRQWRQRQFSVLVPKISG